MELVRCICMDTVLVIRTALMTPALRGFVLLLYHLAVLVSFCFHQVMEPCMRT